MFSSLPSPPAAPHPESPVFRPFLRVGGHTHRLDVSACALFTFFWCFHTSRKLPRPIPETVQAIKLPAEANPLCPLGDVYVSKEPSRPEPKGSGRRSLALSRGCPLPPAERAALLCQLVPAEEHKTKISVDLDADTPGRPAGAAG